MWLVFKLVHGVGTPDPEPSSSGIGKSTEYFDGKVN
jgi:hypothetical protein